MKLQIYNESKKYIKVKVKKDNIFYDLYFVNPDIQSNNVYLDLPDDIETVEDIVYFDDIDKDKREDMLITVNSRISYIHSIGGDRTDNDIKILYLYDFLMISFVEYSDTDYFSVIRTIYGGLYGGISDWILDNIFDFCNSVGLTVDNDTFIIYAEYFKQYISTYSYGDSNLLDYLNKNIPSNMTHIWNNAKLIRNKDSKVLQIKTFLGMSDDQYTKIFKNALNLNLNMYL